MKKKSSGMKKGGMSKGMKMNQHKKMAMTGKPYKEGGMAKGKSMKTGSSKAKSIGEIYSKYM